MTGKHWLEPTAIKTEGLIPLEDPASIEVLEYINKFFTAETKRRYKKYDIMYRSGVLLYGVPGTGKTYTIHRVKEEAIKMGYVVLVDPRPDLVATFVKAIRDITGNPDYQVLVVWEELDKYLIHYENAILELLDGSLTMENIIYIGTTNYINKIPERLKSRPSRFNHVIEVKAPTEGMRRAYFNAKLHADDKAEWLERFVEVSDGLVLDFCKELILSVLVFDKKLETESERLRNMAGLASDDVTDDDDLDDDDDDDDNCE